MLCIVIFSLLFSNLSAYASCSHNATCPVPLQENFIKDSLKTAEVLKQDKDFQSFLAHSLEQRDAALESSTFQDAVGDFQKPLVQASQMNPTPDPLYKPGNFYVFVSFSLGEKALLNLAQEAKRWNAALVLRGFIEGSYAKTAKALRDIIIKTGQGFLIDPELFSLFNVKAVPTYVLSKPFQLHAHARIQTPFHDRIQGHASLQYALEIFVKEGDLREEAHALLKHGGAE